MGVIKSLKNAWSHFRLLRGWDGVLSEDLEIQIRHQHLVHNLGILIWLFGCFIVWKLLNMGLPGLASGGVIILMAVAIYRLFRHRFHFSIPHRYWDKPTEEQLALKVLAHRSPKSIGFILEFITLDIGPETKSKVYDKLVDHLSKLTRDQFNEMSSDHRNSLRSCLLRTAKQRSKFHSVANAIMDTMVKFGNTKDIRIMGEVAKVGMGPVDRTEIQEYALQCYQKAESRLYAEQKDAILLRSSHNDEELLRPANSSGAEYPDQLLRPLQHTQDEETVDSSLR